MSLNKLTTRKYLINQSHTDLRWMPIQLITNLVRFEYDTDEEFPTAIIEAVDVGVGVQNVLQQARIFTKGIDHNLFDFNKLHILYNYSTNDEIICIHDLRQPDSRLRQSHRHNASAALNEKLSQGDNEDPADGMNISPSVIAY